MTSAELIILHDKMCLYAPFHYYSRCSTVVPQYIRWLWRIVLLPIIFVMSFPIYIVFRVTFENQDWYECHGESTCPGLYDNLFSFANMLNIQLSLSLLLSLTGLSAMYIIGIPCSYSRSFIRGSTDFIWKIQGKFS